MRAFFTQSKVVDLKPYNAHAPLKNPWPDLIFYLLQNNKKQVIAMTHSAQVYCMMFEQVKIYSILQKYGENVNLNGWVMRFDISFFSIKVAF